MILESRFPNRSEMFLRMTYKATCEIEQAVLKYKDKGKTRMTTEWDAVQQKYCDKEIFVLYAAERVEEIVSDFDYTLKNVLWDIVCWEDAVEDYISMRD